MFYGIFVLDKPEIDQQPSLLKFASDAGDTAKLICKSQASPLARYAWSRSGSPINTNTTGKYYSTFKQVGTYFKNLLFVNLRNTFISNNL